MGDAYRHGLQEFKDHGFDSAVGDKAVAGIDRAPTELLNKAKERLLALAQTKASESPRGCASRRLDDDPASLPGDGRRRRRVFFRSAERAFPDP